MSTKSLLTSLVLFFVVGSSRLMADESSAADRDWQAIEDLVRLDQPTADMSPLDRERFYERKMVRHREMALAFIEKYPRDPRRWNVVNQLSPRLPRFVKDWGPLNEEGFPEDPVVDTAAAVAWSEKVLALRLELAKAPDVPEALRAEIAARKAAGRNFREKQNAFSDRYRQGIPAPDFIMHDVDGREVRLADFRGKVVELDFWATWCGPCMAAMPDTEAAAVRYRDQGVVVVGSCTGDTRENFEKWVARKKGKYPDIIWTFDPLGKSAESASKKLYAVPGIPAQIVIDREGRTVDATMGYNPDGYLLDVALARAGIKVDPVRLERAAKFVRASEAE